MNAAKLHAELPGGWQALFTCRADGNMSSAGGEACEHGADARERLRARIGVGTLARGFQAHGARVERVLARAGASEPDASSPADGQATALPAVAPLVLAADCLPVALGDGTAVAMIHAGWRGLAAGVLEEGVAALRELGTAASVHAVLGPCAGVCCYEVGAEVHEALTGRPAARGPLDLRAIARARLLAAGTTEVRELGGCTICDERFFSHRREGERAGRQAGVAWLS